MKFDLVVFDWDGTLLDSTATITNSIQAAAADLGLPVPSREQASYVIGMGLQDALAHAVPGLAKDQLTEFVERYKFHYLAKDGQLQLFEGIVDLLAALHGRGVQMGVATGKSRVGLERAMDTTATRHFFAMTRCADEGFSKPHPQMLHVLMDGLMVEPGKTVMIGDTTHDLHLARNAGAHGVGVAYGGAHDLASLKALSPASVHTSVASLHDWLLERV